LADHGINPNHMVGDAQPLGGGTTSATQPTNVNPTTGYYNHSVPMPKTGGMAPLDKEAIMAAYKENSAKLEAPLAAKIANQATVFGDNPTYNQLKNNYTQSSNLIEKNPEIADKVFRLVAQQGPVLNALNEGLGVHAGNFTANINVPVKAWMEGGLSKTEAAVADKMFSSLVSIALGNMKQQGYDMNKIPQGEFMQALSQYVNPNMSALTAANKLHKDAAHFDHQKENYDQMIKERSTKADSNSLTPFTDIQNNSTELRKIAKKHQMIQDQYDAEYQKKIDELKAKEKQKNGGK